MMSTIISAPWLKNVKLPVSNQIIVVLNFGAFSLVILYSIDPNIKDLF